MMVALAWGCLWYVLKVDSRCVVLIGRVLFSYRVV